MRDLSRARQAAKKDLQGKRQQISSLMLRLGRIYPGKKTWGPAHMRWLMAQKLEHREQRIAFEELLEGIRQESERVERLEEAIREAVPEWSLAEVVTALQAMRGIDLIAAVGVLAAIGDLSRFPRGSTITVRFVLDGGHQRFRTRLRRQRGCSVCVPILLQKSLLRLIDSTTDRISFGVADPPGNPSSPVRTGQELFSVLARVDELQNTFATQSANN
jgi:hypothetical protein